jgi:cell division cycle 20-like protein 1, cofactor of APC complex
MGATDDIYSSSISHAHIAKAAAALNTPPVATPLRSTTPPPQAEKRKSDRKATDDGVRSDRASAASGFDPIDPNVLSKALLKEFEDVGKHRDITPGGSPSRKRQRVYGDR